MDSHYGSPSFLTHVSTRSFGYGYRSRSRISFTTPDTVTFDSRTTVAVVVLHLHLPLHVHVYSHLTTWYVTDLVYVVTLRLPSTVMLLRCSFDTFCSLRSFWFGFGYGHTVCSSQLRSHRLVLLQFVTTVLDPTACRFVLQFWLVWVDHCAAPFGSGFAFPALRLFPVLRITPRTRLFFSTPPTAYRYRSTAACYRTSPPHVLAAATHAYRATLFTAARDLHTARTDTPLRTVRTLLPFRTYLPAVCLPRALTVYYFTPCYRHLPYPHPAATRTRLALRLPLRHTGSFGSARSLPPRCAHRRMYAAPRGCTLFARITHAPLAHASLHAPLQLYLTTRYCRTIHAPFVPFCRLPHTCLFYRIALRCCTALARLPRFTGSRICWFSPRLRTCAHRFIFS